MIKSFFDKLNIEYIENASLKKYNTYRIDASCSYLVFPKSIEELINILKELDKEKIKHFVLGNGSNIILSMNHYDGVFIKLDKLNNVTYNDNVVTAEAGCSLIKLSLETMNRGLSGLEFASAIPGLVGASTAMNAGAYNSDMASVTKEVVALDDKYNIVTLKNEELDFSYRDSFLKKNPSYIVLSTTFELSKGDTETMKEQALERKKKRIASQPLEYPNAGSVFRNPENMYAGELIEKSNLKGYNINGAEVSTKHANFIINKGNATGKDILNLIEKIKNEVKKNYQVDLKLEQIIIE